ncbi:MAG: hypothetical protein K0R54_558 [Clostridiaceae bacterium]|jgi:uncharacterized protein YeaO (DUF488 family)|nr:hypothetical protein [Clostridiaceae bacterium]
MDNKQRMELWDILHLAYLGEAKKLNLSENTKKFFIVRKPVGGIPKGFIHVPQLSPSIELFDKTQKWKKNEFNDDEIKELKTNNISLTDKSAWLYFYKTEFYYELNNRPDMVRALNNLMYQLDEAEEIYLFCYCKNLEECHRYLIGQFIQNKGYKVDYGNTFTSKCVEVEAFNIKQISLFDTY